jgi:hypothetical protein
VGDFLLGEIPGAFSNFSKMAIFEKFDKTPLFALRHFYFLIQLIRPYKFF